MSSLPRAMDVAFQDQLQAMTRDLIAGASRSLFGAQVVTSQFLKDGSVLMAGAHHMIVGTRPWTSLEVDRETARRIVRTGLADVLRWLGEDPGPTLADPYPAIGGLDILRQVAS